MTCPNSCCDGVLIDDDTGEEMDCTTCDGRGEVELSEFMDGKDEYDPTEKMMEKEWRG